MAITAIFAGGVTVVMLYVGGVAVAVLYVGGVVVVLTSHTLPLLCYLLVVLAACYITMVVLFTGVVCP